MASKRSSSSTARARAKRIDAIGLLKADHRQVETWFAQFSKSKNPQKKQQLATLICEALTVHTVIEEEIFYPAFIEATGDKPTHHEAVVEHAGAKKLIAEIQAMSSADDYFDANVTVLSEMIKHHVKEEEQRGKSSGVACPPRRRRPTWIFRRWVSNFAPGSGNFKHPPRQRKTHRSIRGGLASSIPL
jgi:hemerythrin superfamily protein